MNVVLVNLEANMGMNVNIHPHFGWWFFIHLMLDEKIAFNIFLINRTSIKIIVECFILSWIFYG